MKLYYTSEEVAEHLEIPSSTLTFYIKEFKLSISKVGRIRKFKHTDVEKLAKIVDLIDKKGFTLDGAKEQLKNKQKNNQEIVSRLKDIKSSLLIINDMLTK